jgi:hypothetical protein
MPIDPRIAMGYQAPQIESPLNQFAKFQQIQSAQRANELANMQMQEYQRGLQEQEGLRNYLAGNPDLSSPEGLLRFGKPGAEMAKTLSEQASEQAKLRETQAKTESSQFDLSRKRLAAGYQAVSSAQNAADVMAALDEGVQLGYFTQQQADAQKSELAALQTMPEFQKWQQGKLRQFVSAEKQLDMSTPKPVAPPAMVAEYQFAKTPEGGSFVGSYQDFVTARAAAGRAPVQPRQEPAPSVTTIVDPNNPSQMIAIDARRYQGGGAGAPGVIGVSGKEPGAAIRQNKTEAGKTQLADDLENLRTSFKTLDEMRAIPSTQRNFISNILSSTAATGAGQMLGRATGTEAQVEREVINSARTRLVNSIKNATGMSAQQLNSNVELQTMLKSISDPRQPIEAALRIIDDIENAYVKGPSQTAPTTGGGQIPLPSAGGAKPTSPGPASPLPAAAGKTIVRTGTLNGRKVAQYSDGSSGYVD